VHFHRGKFRGDEFVPRYFLASFDDPTFDKSLRYLARVAHNAIIEWLQEPWRRRSSPRPSPRYLDAPSAGTRTGFMIFPLVLG
jgi:hypothetical protein